MIVRQLISLIIVLAQYDSEAAYICDDSVAQYDSEAAYICDYSAGTIWQWSSLYLSW